MSEKTTPGDSLSKDRMRILENLHDGLARKLASSFSTVQRSVVDCDIAFVDQTSYGEFVKSLPNPSCSYTFSLEPFGGKVVLDYSLPTAYSFIDRQFGGTGGNPPSEARPLTAIERTVMGRVLKRSLADLETTWGALFPVQARDAQLETNPGYLRVAENSAHVILVAFEVNSQHASGLVRLCYPFESLGPALTVLKPGVPGVSRAAGGVSTAAVKSPAPPQISADASLEEVAAQHPAIVAGALEGLLADSGNARGPWKAAVLVACLPKPVTPNLIHQLSSEGREALAKAVQDLKMVTAANREEVFAEVKGRLVRGDYVLQGAAESAKQALAGGEMSTSGFYLLRHVAANQIIPFISKEHPQTIALILSQLEAKQAAGVLEGFSDALAADVAYRMGCMENISPVVLRELEVNLAEALATLIEGRVTEVGGPKAVAEILNSTGRTTEKTILERLDKQDPEFGEDVRNLMFVYDDIANLTDAEVGLVLEEVEEMDLAVGLKGADEAMKKKVFRVVGEERAEVLKGKMDFSGPVRMSDVEEVQLRTVAVVRGLEREGKVKVVRGDSGDLWV
jgi:flagellar motor switch protein FliG